MKRSELRKLNPERAQTRRDTLKAWHSSSAWRRQRKESLDLAGGRCEFIWQMYRCSERDRLHVHELHYRFEQSTPADRQVLCAYHHALIERRDHPTRRRGQ